MIAKSIICLLLLATLALGAKAQDLVVVNDPTLDDAPAGKLSPAEMKLFDEKVIEPVNKVLASDTCTPSADIAGVADGSFTRRGARQRAIFYQFCQTGNGFGWVGLAIIENGRLIGSFIEDSGWSQGIGAVKDLNSNGLDEITLLFGGGVHQGQGGTGMDLMEFKNGRPQALGFYVAESFDESDNLAAWRLTAKRGQKPVFYRQEFRKKMGSKWRAVGRNSVFRLKPSTGKFEVVDEKDLGRNSGNIGGDADIQR